MTAIAESDHWQVPPSLVDDETRVDEVLLEVGILVPLVVLALMALAIPLALVVMSVINVLSWVVARMW